MSHLIQRWRTEQARMDVEKAHRSPRRGPAVALSADCGERKGASRYRGTARRPIPAFFCVGEKSRSHPIHVDGSRQCPNGARATAAAGVNETLFISRDGTARWPGLCSRDVRLRRRPAAQ